MSIAKNEPTVAQQEQLLDIARASLQKDDEVLRLALDLHRQATTEHSHYYTATVLRRLIAEVIALRVLLRKANKGKGDAN